MASLEDKPEAVEVAVSNAIDTDANNPHGTLLKVNLEVNVLTLEEVDLKSRGNVGIVEGEWHVVWLDAWREGDETHVLHEWVKTHLSWVHDVEHGPVIDGSTLGGLIDEIDTSEDWSLMIDEVAWVGTH